MKIKSHHVAFIMTMASSLAILAWSRSWLERRSTGKEESLQEVLLVPPGDVIRQIDLGYHTLAADLMFIRANLYYGSHMLTDEQTPWLSSFIDILLQVDPDFKKVYLWGALATTYYKREVDFVPRELVDRANSILEKGAARFPSDYRFPMRIGFNLYYEAGDPEAAIAYFSTAASKPGAPDWLNKKLVDLFSKIQKKSMAKRVLESIAMGTEDPNLSKTLKERLVYILSPQERQHLLDLRSDLMRQWQAQWAFVPFDLFLLLRTP